NAFATLHTISYFGIEHDPAREQSCNLLEDYHSPVTFNGHGIMLIQIRRGLAHGVHELALLIFHVGNCAGDWRAVYVNVEHVEKNADPRALTSIHRSRRNAGHFSVGGRNYCAGRVWKHPCRIAEKPQKEQRKQKSRHCPERRGEPANENSSCGEKERVIVAV